MKQMLFVCVGVLLLSTPACARAAVLISEVAWMGTSADANAEWIELYNAGDAQDVTGWTLSAKDGQPSMTLSGTIGSNTYALLERSDDVTVPNIAAFAVYTGALGNTGELLELRNEKGVLVDSVDGADEWSIGGDNETKETAQRSGDPPVGAWSTGAPNPQGGAIGSSEVGDSDTESTQTSAGGKSFLLQAEADEGKKPHLEPTLTLDLGGERVVTVGVPTSFLARAHKANGGEIVVSDILWNFGDGTTKRGREVEHTFTYAGEYLVTASGERSGFLREVKDSQQIVVHVVEPSIEIVHADALYIELENVRKETVDISGFVLVSGSSHFRIPNSTYVLPQTKVRFSSKTTGVQAEYGASLFYPDGSLVAVYGNYPESEQGETYVPSYTVENAREQASEDVVETASPLGAMQIPEVLPEFTKTANAYEGASENTTSENQLRWWLLALFAGIGATVVVVLLVRKEQAEVIEGFYIESEDL